METDQGCIGREVGQHHASASTTGPGDFTTSNNLSALSEKDKSPEAIVAKLFGKSESDLAIIKKSMRIAENVVLGPSTSANVTGPSTAAAEEQPDTHSPRETLLPRQSILGNPKDYMNNAAALANKLMLQTSVNIPEKDSNQAPVILPEKDNQETTQFPEDTRLDEGRETRIQNPQRMDIQKEHGENSDVQRSSTQVHKTHSQKSESENPSILSVLSNMAAEAGMEDVDTVGSSNSPVVQPIPTSQKSSFPEICNDYVPVASNISFDYSIASLINNENSTSKDTEDSVMGRESVNQISPITKQQSESSLGTTGSIEKPQLVSSATEIVSSVASNYPQGIATSNLGSNAPSAVTQVSQTMSSREQGGQSVSARQPISTTPPTIQSSSFQQQHRSPAQASQPVANSGALMHGASISTAPVSNVPQPSVVGPSAFQMPELNLPDLRELDSLSSIFSEPHVQQPHMMAWNNFNVAQPVPSPIRTHHDVTIPHVPSASATLAQHSPVMQTSPSPTLSHQGPFTQPLQSPTLPHQGTVARPVPSPALSPHRSSRTPHGGIMAPPQVPQQNVNRLPMVQDHMNARQLNTGMSFTHSQQTALANSMSATQNQYYGNTTQPNQLTGYSTPRELVHWQNDQANAWRGPLGMGMQGREGYGQFHEFRIRPQRQQFNAISHGHQNIPSSVYDMNIGTQGQFPNVAMQTLTSNDNMTREIARYAMAEIQKQNMQSNMNRSMYQRPQMQAQSLRPQIPQHPHTPSAANPPQRGIPLASFANRELRNNTRPAQQYNSARVGHTQNSIDNQGGQLPLQLNLPPGPRFQGHLQLRNPQYSQSMHSGLDRHQTPSMQNTQRPQFRSPQTAKRMPVPKQPVRTSAAQLPTSRSSTQQAPRHVQSSTTTSNRMPTTTSTSTQKSNKAATPSAPSTLSNSDLDGQSLAALVVESVLKGHDTNHVEQQIRLVNELMKGKSSTKSTASSSSTTERNTSGSQDVSPSLNKPANSSASTTPSSKRASSRSESSGSESIPHSQTTPATKPSSQTNLEQSSQHRKKPGRPQEMFVDLTADETESTVTPPVQKRKNPDMDIHILIEIVNTKSQDLQFCILEKCLRNECQPKYLTRCHLSHNWWIYQSEKKSIYPTSEDVTCIAKQIIHSSLHDKVYFREQMTAVLQSQDLKRAKIFQALCTEKIHVVGRAFQRPKAQAGLLYLNALKYFPPNGSLSMYLSATTSNNIIQKVAKITEEEQSRQKEPQVLVIEPIPDSAPTVLFEPEMPPSEPHRPPLSAEERYTLENQQPIVIEPPPTPAPIPCFADGDDVAPVIIEPQVASQSESSIREQSQNDQQQVSNTDLLSQRPLVIAPPTTARAPSPNTVQRKSPAAPNQANAAEPNSSKEQDPDVMQPPSQMQVPGSKQTSSGIQGPPVPGYVPSSMPQSVLEVLNSNAPAHNQPELWQYQAQVQFNIQKQLQTQQKQQPPQQDQQQQRLPSHQQLLMHHQRAPSPVQFTTMQSMLYMSQGGPTSIQPPVVANISEQERPAGPQAILQGLVPKPTPFMGETPLPIVLSKNPSVPDSVAGQPVPIPMSSTHETNKPNSLPPQPQGEPRPVSSIQKVTQGQISAHLTVDPTAQSVIKHSNERNSPNGHPQQEKLDTLGDASGVDREFISLEDFITMSTDNGREVCASVSSSIDGDKKEAETPCNEQPKSSLLENGLPVDERDRMGKRSLRIEMKRIEDIYDSLGLKRLSKSHYRIKSTSSLMKPKRATVRRRFVVDDGIPLEDSDNDPAWEGISSSENSPSSHNSSTDEYSEGEETEEEDKYKRTWEDKYKRTCIRIKRPFSTSSDEDEVKNCDFYDSSSESPRKGVASNESKRRKRRKWQIGSAKDTGKSPGKEIDSDTCGESPVKVQRRKRRVIDSDDDSPFKKADPFFPPSPVENKSAQESPSQPETDARSTPDVTKDVEALRNICPSLQPSVQVARLTPGEIHGSRKPKWKGRRRKKKKIIKEPSKPVGNQQTGPPQASQKSNNSSQHESGSDTEPCETESFDNTQQADSDPGVPPASTLQRLPVAYDLEFFTSDELWEELQRRQDLISCICGMTFVDRKHYNLHRDLHDKVNPKKCAICCEVFQDWIEFTSHTYSTHNSM